MLKIIKSGTYHNGLLPKREVITMTFSEVMQLITTVVAVITLVYKVIKDIFDKK